MTFLHSEHTHLKYPIWRDVVVKSVNVVKCVFSCICVRGGGSRVPVVCQRDTFEVMTQCSLSADVM